MTKAERDLFLAMAKALVEQPMWPTTQEALSRAIRAVEGETVTDGKCGARGPVGNEHLTCTLPTGHGGIGHSDEIARRGW